MATYNGERYLAKTIESILAQSFRDYEFVIVDDGSCDRTRDILESYRDRDARIRVLYQENHGVGYSFNRGLVEARSALIAVIDHDDLALPGRLETQVTFLERNLDHVLVGGYLEIIDENDRSIGLRKYPTTDRALRQALPLFDPFGHPSLMFRREPALAAGGYTSRFSTGSDYDLILRLAKFGKVANIAEPLTAYRFHPDAVKARQTVRQLSETLHIKEVAYREYGYRETLPAKFVNAAQRLMMRLPSRLIYWLFSIVVVRKSTSAPADLPAG